MAALMQKWIINDLIKHYYIDKTNQSAYSQEQHHQQQTSRNRGRVKTDTNTMYTNVYFYFLILFEEKNSQVFSQKYFLKLDDVYVKDDAVCVT